MTAPPTGAALDRACAEAMGTYVAECDGAMAEFYDGWICDGCHTVTGTWGADLEPHAKCPRYSTDHATLPESFAWLRERTVKLHVDIYEHDVEVIAVFPHKLGGHVEAAGKELPEAVARLVCAVAAALPDARSREEEQ